MHFCHNIDLIPVCLPWYKKKLHEKIFSKYYIPMRLLVELLKGIRSGSSDPDGESDPKAPPGWLLIFWRLTVLFLVSEDAGALPTFTPVCVLSYWGCLLVCTLIKMTTSMAKMSKVETSPTMMPIKKWGLPLDPCDEVSEIWKCRIIHLPSM